MKYKTKSELHVILYTVRKMNNIRIIVNKRQRIPKGKSKIDNPEKLVKSGTQDEEK